MNDLKPNLWSDSMESIRTDIRELRNDTREDVRSIRDEIRAGFEAVGQKLDAHSNALHDHTTEDHKNFEAINVTLAAADAKDSTVRTSWERIGMWATVVGTLALAVIDAFKR